MVQLKWFGGLVVAVALVLGVNNSADAHHHHSCGSYGSCGSSGGSYGSWGSCGSSGGSSGGYYHHHRHHAHGSSGSSGSSGNYGSYGSSGSSGGYGMPSAPAGMPGPSGPPAPPVAPPPPEAAVAPPDSARLILSVPSDAVVYLSNQRMTLEGTSREYVIPGLTAGLQYRYPVRIDVVRDGRTVSADADQQVQAGQEVRLAYNQAATQPEIVSMRD